MSYSQHICDHIADDDCRVIAFVDVLYRYIAVTLQTSENMKCEVIRNTNVPQMTVFYKNCKLKHAIKFSKMYLRYKWIIKQTNVYI